MDPNSILWNPDVKDEVKHTKLMRGYDRMKLSGGQQYQFNQLKNEIHMALASNTFPSTIFNTVNNIARVINAIRLTGGIDWAQTVMDNGQPAFTPVEQQRYTELLQPYVPSILEFFEESMPHYLQKGGALPATIGTPAPGPVGAPMPAVVAPAVVAPVPAVVAGEPAVVAGEPAVAPVAAVVAGAPEAEAAAPVAEAAAEAPVAPVAAPVAPGSPVPVSLMGMTPGGTGPMPVSLMAMPAAAPEPAAPVPEPEPEVPTKMSKLKDSLQSGLSDKLKNIDMSTFTPDILFDKVMSTYQGINRSMNENMEAVHFEKEVDKKPDIILGGVPISPRLIIFLIYYILDITRVAVSISGNETGRKLLSIVITILDVVRGDWKKAILTFVGYYGSYPLLIGQTLKTYLTVIQMLSPTIQIKIPYFMYDSAKSMVFGILLSIIQIGAPQPVRNQLEGLLATLSNVQKDIDAKLNALNPPLSSRPEYFKVDFSNLNDLQAILDDPVYICSKEHREAVENLLANAKDGAPMIQIVLSLIRYPHTRGMTKYLCDSKTKTSYVDLLVAEGLEREKKEANAKANSKPDADMATPVNSTPSAPLQQSVPPAAVASEVVPEPVAQGAASSKPFVYQSSTPTDELLPPDLLRQQSVPPAAVPSAAEIAAPAVEEAQLPQKQLKSNDPSIEKKAQIMQALKNKQKSGQAPTKSNMLGPGGVNKSKLVKSEYEKKLEAEAVEEVAAEEAARASNPRSLPAIISRKGGGHSRKRILRSSKSMPR